MQATRARAAGLPEALPGALRVVGTGDMPVVFVAVATDAELTRLGARSSALGEAAMVLARRIDLDVDAGGGFTALVKELRATMRDVAAASPPGKDAVDELQARRRKRHAAAQRD